VSLSRPTRGGVLYHWVTKLVTPTSDRADFVQDIFTLLVRELPRFEYQPDKGFHAWLWIVIKNKWHERGRRASVRPSLVGDEQSLLAATTLDNTLAIDEAEYRKYLVSRALQLMQAEFQPTTWKACWECVVHDRPAADVAKELGITVNAVYVASSRVVRRLRQELAGLLD
jgi:RNA polymerase sigma-70 factor (ECF subfamily)